MKEIRESLMDMGSRNKRRFNKTLSKEDVEAQSVAKKKNQTRESELELDLDFCPERRTLKRLRSRLKRSK